MRRRPSSLFRGSELPRLLFLVAIVLAGWPMIVLFSRPQAAEDKPTPPASVPVSSITKINPDTSVEFQALKDNQPIQVRESAAYATLLRRARETPAPELAAQARKDVFWTQLWERPQAYRGVPIHIEGTAKKVLAHEVGPSMSPSGRLYEVWVFCDETPAFPYVVTIEDPPPGLVVGTELFLRVKVDGYFLKQLGYRAVDMLRAAPMLVGRMSWIPALAPAPSPIAEFRDWSRKDGVVVLVALLVGYLLIRAFFQFRKVFATDLNRLAHHRSSSEGLPPDEVADWLRNLPDDSPEPEEDVPPLRDGPHLGDR